MLIHSIFTACWQSSNSVVAEDYFNVIEKLHVNLLANYNKQIRPVINNTQALDVDASMKLISFDYV